MAKVSYHLKRFRSVILFLITIAIILLATTSQTVLGHADLLKLDLFAPQPNESITNVTSISSASIRLDGYKLFVIAAPATSQSFPLEQRVQYIEEELNRLSNSNIEPSTLPITVKLDPQGKQPIISIGDRYLMTVTTLDAQINGRDPQSWANQLTQILRDALVRAIQERRGSFLLERGLLSLGILAGMIAFSWIATYWQGRLKKPQKSVEANIEADFNSQSAENAIFKSQILWHRQANLCRLQQWGLQLGQLGIWSSGSYIILGLFPYTRWIQPLLLSTPLQVLVIILTTYLMIRIANVLIDVFSGLIKDGDFIGSQRLELRISTVSKALKNIIAIVWIGVGMLLILSAIGVNLLPLLTGLGIIGLAISFAAQGIIKDVINGFLIILEDQYAIGDVIVMGNLGGFVENMNLRITQLRNNEGQLITIPNSNISTIQNLSKDWARVDLTITVSYENDPDMTLDVLKQLSQEIYSDRHWRSKILELPEVLGIDELQHTGMLIRIWIKTQPLQQWAVAREFRRRIKLTMAKQKIAIGIPQQYLLMKSRSNCDSNDSEPMIGEVLS